ncbi:NAD(+)/NADH kinase [Halomarina pelagica]|uniref:NAD(+)/NADH kinase n=1 Tax=Halomarina pelagica TaxID=2961599 RepID=UPI0020C30342|nr:NAD(+)/NADH kinase [Halomarina sp. BND7]
MATVGLVVNPSAGRDIRRLTGGASVSDRYAKVQTARCVLAGLTTIDPPPDVLVMPDKANVGQGLVEEAVEAGEIDAALLDQSVTGSGEDTRRAADALCERADAVVVLGGDGTNRDVATGIGDVPVASISTGTNNVVPTAIDGTPAGAAAALVATGRVPAADVTVRHGTVVAAVDDNGGHRRFEGLAALSVLDRPFVGTRAVLDPGDFLGGVVSRASPGDVGLSGVAGTLGAIAPDDPGGAGLRLGPPDDAPRTVRAMTTPGVVGRIGVREHRRLDDGEAMTFDVPEGVLSADGERELEVHDAHVEVRPRPDGPRFVDFDAVFERAADEGLFVE